MPLYYQRPGGYTQICGYFHKWAKNKPQKQNAL